MKECQNNLEESSAMEDNNAGSSPVQKGRKELNLEHILFDKESVLSDQYEVNSNQC